MTLTTQNGRRWRPQISKIKEPGFESASPQPNLPAPVHTTESTAQTLQRSTGFTRGQFMPFQRSLVQTCTADQTVLRRYM